MIRVPALGRVTCHCCSVQRGLSVISIVSMEIVNKQSVIGIEKFCLSQTEDYSAGDSESRIQGL